MWDSPFRLTAERVRHIERRHPKMKGQETSILEAVSLPDAVREGDSGTLIAVKHYPKTPLSEKFCAVVHKELGLADGFIVTAYFTTKPAEWRETKWKR